MPKFIPKEKNFLHDSVRMLVSSTIIQWFASDKEVSKDVSGKDVADTLIGTEYMDFTSNAVKNCSLNNILRHDY